MGLKPYDRVISQIFNNVKYDIDFYQREYKWNDQLDYKPVSSLLKDIFYRFDLENYNPNQTITADSINKLEWYYLNSFMTNIVGGTKYVVDGQQRLTTITLISIALYHLAKQFESEDYIVATLRNSVQGTTEFGPTYWMGFKDRESALDDLLKHNLSFSREPATATERNIYANYTLIVELLTAKFTTRHKLETFISYIRHRVYLIEIEVHKDKDVAMVFEVINDRGVPLKPYEILKGKLLSQIDMADRSKYVDIWESSVNECEKYGESQIDEFFSFYFRSKYADTADQYRWLETDRYHKSIFLDEYNTRVQLKNNEHKAREFIEKELPFYVRLYCDVLKYAAEYNNAYEHIYFNALNDLSGQFLLILSTIKMDDPGILQKIQLVSKLFDKYVVGLQLTNSFRSNDFNARVIALSEKIRERSIVEIEASFAEQLFDDVCQAHDRSELPTVFFYEFFKTVNYNSTGKRFLRYLFARVDHYISDFSDVNEYGTYYQLVAQSKGNDTYHIEHILANNQKNVELFADEEEFNVQRNRLGGLLLLKGKDNESSGAETYEEKLKTYNVSGTYYARTLLEDMYHKKVTFADYINQHKLAFKPYKTFGKNEVEERHNLLFELAKRIWGL